MPLFAQIVIQISLTLKLPNIALSPIHRTLRNIVDGASKIIALPSGFGVAGELEVKISCRYYFVVLTHEDQNILQCLQLNPVHK